MKDEKSQPTYWVYETTVPGGKRLVLNKDMIKSKPFIKLTGTAKQILVELYTRIQVDARRPAVTRARHNKEQRFVAANNGELQLTYRSITRQFGYAPATISQAIDKLCSYDFIEIAELGCGVRRESHKIALIENWRDYGTDAFKPGKGKADGPVNGGFKKGNRYGKRGRRNSKKNAETEVVTIT